MVIRGLKKLQIDQKKQHRRRTVIKQHDEKSSTESATEADLPAPFT